MKWYTLEAEGSLTCWTESGIMRDLCQKIPKRNKKRISKTGLMGAIEIHLMNKNLHLLFASQQEECFLKQRSLRIPELLLLEQVTPASHSLKLSFQSVTCNSLTLFWLPQVAFQTVTTMTSMIIWKLIQQVIRWKSWKNLCLKAELESLMQEW